MSTRFDDGPRGALLYEDDDDWFATPETRAVESAALPWENELEWQLRDPSAPDLGRRQAAIVLVVVVAVLLVLAGILIGRATKSAKTVVTTTPAAQAQDSSTGTGSGSNTAADNNATDNNSANNNAAGNDAAGTGTPNTNASTPDTGGSTPSADTTTPTAVPTGATLRTGSKGDAVTTLQTALTSLGYKPGTADGTYSAATAAAVTAFQTAKGLTADGVAGAKTLEAINTALAASASTDTSTGTDTSTPSSDAVPTDARLQLGSKGDGVIALQTALSRLGYAPGTADGTYGATTAQAVTAFQTAKSITADGIAGAATLEAINAALASG